MADEEKEFENPVYLIEFVYSSSARIRYWFKEFSIGGGTAKWSMVCNKCQPLHLNINEIESIHQLDIKELNELRDPTDTRLSWER